VVMVGLSDWGRRWERWVCDGVGERMALYQRKSHSCILNIKS